MENTVAKAPSEAVAGLALLVADAILAMRAAGHSEHDIATTLIAAGVGLARGLPDHRAFAAFLCEVGETLLVEPNDKGN